jgi:multiple sugar transport system ATP-binding protein
MTLGDRVVVMNKGVVQQVDTPDRLYRHPTNTFVAGFIGSPSMNFFEGQLSAGRLQLGAHTLELADTAKSSLGKKEGEVIVGLRPEDFLLGGDDSVTIAAKVEISERLGPEVLVHLRADGLTLAAIGAEAAKSEDEQAGELSDTIVARFDPSFSASTGETISLGVNRERLQLFDPQSGASLLPA